MPFQDNPQHVEQDVTQKKRGVKQESTGNNSPNISTGDHATITFNNSTQARNPRFREKVEKVTLWLGGMGAGFSVAQLAKPNASAFQFGGQKPFAVYMENGTIYVDVNIPGPNADSPAIEIKKNEFSQPPSRWDRNFDDSALEFVNQNGVPVFQMIYGDSEVRIMGVFDLGNGAVLVANGSVTSISSRGPTISGPAAIFKYPSYSHKGERIIK